MPSTSAWWLSRFEESFAARQRAYSSYAAAGEDPRAAWCAARLSVEHFLRGEASVAAGWLMRARRHLHDQPECVQHGFVAVCEGAVAHFRGQLDEAMPLAERATEIGQRFGDRDLVAMGIHLQGLVRISAANVHEGMALLDEAMTSVVAGELSPYFTGVIYCNVLSVCLDLADLGRAGEWNKAATAWCESLPEQAPFPGLCLLNRVEAASLQGAWPEAEAQATRATKVLTFNPMAAAHAFYETGEIRRRIGNLAGAEQAFTRAHELGFEPQPGLALLRLAQGRAEAALSALTRAVAGESRSRLRRARLLAAQVEVALAAGDRQTATVASQELDAIARDFRTPALAAGAAAARGALRLAEGDAPAAIEALRHACATWQELRLPYETAQARMLYGVALRGAGHEEDAKLELRALSVSEHTVARHLQNIFAKLGVSSRAAATAFAVERGLA